MRRPAIAWAAPLDVSTMDDLGWAGWLGMGLMMLAMVALIGFVAWLIVRAVRPDRDGPRHAAGDDALQALQTRYARGEISTEEFEERRDRLAHGRSDADAARD